VVAKWGATNEPIVVCCPESTRHLPKVSRGGPGRPEELGVVLFITRREPKMSCAVVKPKRPVCEGKGPVKRWFRGHLAWNGQSHAV